MWGVVAASWRRAYARSARTFQPGQPTRGAIVDPRSAHYIIYFLPILMSLTMHVARSQMA